jgi:hypothetical protein
MPRAPDADEPPPDALPLAEALENLVDPALADALRAARDRLAVAEAATGGARFGRPGDSVYEELAAVAQYGEAAVAALRHARTTLGQCLEACTTYVTSRCAAGEYRAWGREDTAWGRWIAIQPDAWRGIIVAHSKTGLVYSGRKAARKYLHGVVVARPPETRSRGRTTKQDARAHEEMRKRLLADRMLTERDHRRLAEQLIDEGLVSLDGAQPESVIRRLVAGFRCRKFED